MGVRCPLCLFPRVTVDVIQAVILLRVVQRIINAISGAAYVHSPSLASRVAASLFFSPIMSFPKATGCLLYHLVYASYFVTQVG